MRATAVLYQKLFSCLWTKGIVFIVLLLPAVSASANWESVESPHFRVYYQEETVDPASILQIAEDFYAEMSQLTRFIPAGMIDIWVCDTQLV